MSINEHRYLDRPEQWEELAERIRRAKICGLDTEFYGLDVRKQSCVGRARVHVWSVAIRTTRLDPRGFHRARGWVLPVAALDHPALKAVLEDPAVRKCVHNQPVDDHALHNHGVDLRGCINTLDLARWCWPELVAGDGFGLKALMQSKLARDPVCEFRDVVSDVRTVTKTKQKLVEQTRCSCGVEGCRKRKGHDKTKVEAVVVTFTTKEETYEHPLESIVPGHERWDLLVEYAAEDAIAALELEELCRNTADPAPWPYALLDDASADDRPTFSQGVVDEVVLMERRGFPVDTVYALKQLTAAKNDEQLVLHELRAWFRKNITSDDGEWFTHEDDDVNAIWSSPTQLTDLFDYFEFPRSPVWKKGKVKRGEVKMDGAALEWIAKNHPPAAKLIDRILHLKKIRSQMKYFQKLAECGGHVHPICGPAGDFDGRNGAVTGRLGIKGVLEAQQLPIKKEVDLYQVRRAIVA